MWDERYSQPGFAFGSEPNEFLVAVANQIPPGRVLSLGEGEGRNAVYLASLGHQVVAVDQSQVGLAKAQKLAADRGLKIETICADLATFPIEPGSWSGIVSIFCHLPRQIRGSLYASVVRGLQAGGIFVLEAYTPEQVGRGTGGPQDPDMMPSLLDLTRELAGLELIHAQELERDVREGAYHTGVASVVQFVAKAKSPGTSPSQRYNPRRLARLSGVVGRPRVCLSKELRGVLRPTTEIVSRSSWRIELAYQRGGQDRESTSRKP